MITKIQAESLTTNNTIRQTHYFKTERCWNNGVLQLVVKDKTPIPLDKPINWCISGKIKTWKTRPDEFRLPLEYGLYDYGELTQENNHLFELI